MEARSAPLRAKPLLYVEVAKAEEGLSVQSCVRASRTVGPNAERRDENTSTTAITSLPDMIGVITNDL
jgi:hypothetical protein